MSATTSTTLSFFDEKQFLTVIQLVLPLHECVGHAPTEFATKPLHYVADSVADADPAVVESAIEPLHFAATPIGSGATLTETFCLCVQV
jgi:hypothetical protein